MGRQMNPWNSKAGLEKDQLVGGNIYSKDVEFQILGKSVLSLIINFLLKRRDKSRYAFHHIGKINSRWTKI